jgi:hypothetical protein
MAGPTHRGRDRERLRRSGAMRGSHGRPSVLLAVVGVG